MTPPSRIYHPGEDDSCSYAGDADCDDGGPGSEFNACSPGTDLTDCGSRSGLELSCDEDGADGSEDRSAWTTAIKVECRDCKVKMKADIHVLIRTTNTDPFAESWAWGDLSLVGKVDINANASARYSQTIGPKKILGLICPPYVIAAV